MPAPSDKPRGGVCHIVAGGPSSGLSLELSEGDFLIAADRGYALCVASGALPDLLVGDFDSLPPEALPPEEAVERVTLPVAKDDTDTLAAAKEGLSRGYRRFEVHAALGGDVGHEIANVQTLLYLRGQGAWGCLSGDSQRLYVIVSADGERALPVAPGERVGVFSIAGEAEGVVLRGLAWELDGETLRPDFPLGASNRAVGGEMEVGVSRGALAVVVG